MTAPPRDPHPGDPSPPDSGSSDVEAILDYLDERSAPAARIAHELRLARDPELRREHLAFERLDVLARVAQHRRRWQGAAPPPPRRGALVAAAASVALLSFLAWRSAARHAGLVDVRVAAVPTAVTLLEHNVRLGLAPEDRDKVPAGYGLRGAGARVVPDADYLKLVEGPARARLERALEARPGDGTEPVETFVLAVAPSPSPTSALVLLVDDAGRLRDAAGALGRAAFPVEPAWDASSGLLPADGPAVLPRAQVAPVVDELGPRLDYSPGFLVPRGAAGSTALVGLRPAALDDALREALERDARRGPTSVAHWRAWLVRHGFRVETLRVETPRR